MGGRHNPRDVVGDTKVNILHVGEERQHADAITKALNITLFERHVRALGNLGLLEGIRRFV